MAFKERYLTGGKSDDKNRPSVAQRRRSPPYRYRFPDAFTVDLRNT